MSVENRGRKKRSPDEVKQDEMFKRGDFVKKHIDPYITNIISQFKKAEFIRMKEICMNENIPLITPAKIGKELHNIMIKYIEAEEKGEMVKKKE